ncbi:MAG: hypothetical protein KH611_10710, partial [Clostridium sp.]|nr:hypothetical protein [Clostridium sp.]
PSAPADSGARQRVFMSEGERREKQAAAKQTFVFHKRLTNEPSASADSRARQRVFMSGREIEI